MPSLFEKIKKDVTRGIEEGIAAVREGANVVSGKMVELTAEGKRQYKMYDLKAKIQTRMTELGGRAYELLDSKKSPATDTKIQATFARIKKLEDQLCKLEAAGSRKSAAAGKRVAKPKAAPKRTAAAAARKPAAKAAPEAASAAEQPEP